MSDAISEAFRAIATANNATAMEELELSATEDGAVTLLGARDANGRSRIVLPTTQVLQLAASLLQHWQDVGPTVDPRVLNSDLPALMQVMSTLAIGANGASAAPLPGGVRIGFMIGGAPLYIQLQAEQALALVEKILAVIETDPSAPSPKQ